MSGKNTGDQGSVYGRELLLLGPKRNAVLELWEVQRYGTDSYSDADYVSIYGMRPADWYAKGVRLLGRTAVECTHDRLGDAIARDVAAIAVAAPFTGNTSVIDPFAGSGNTLYWILQHLPGARGVGCELDPLLFELTRQNLAALQLSIDILNADYQSGLAKMPVTADQLLITFIAPPWGEALSRSSGLDLRRTTPPIPEIVDFVVRHFAENRLLCAIQVYQRTDPVSLAELKERFDWSALRMYDLNSPGENHGLLLGTHRWVPSHSI
jgi:16S rRNA G966 N2-methylase RsmD